MDERSIIRRSLSRRGFMALSVLGASGLLVPLTSCASKPTTASPGPLSSAADAAKSSEELLVERVQDQMSNMTLEQKVAQLFVVRPEDLLGISQIDGAVTNVADTSGEALTEMSDSLASALETMPVGGIICFARNLVDPDQTKRFLSEMRKVVEEASGVIPLLCVDEEGGLVARVASNEAFGVDDVGDAAQIGAADDPAKAKEASETIAAYLKELGFNTDFAPVADVVDDPDDKVMTARSFGSDPEVVAHMVAAEVEGFNEADMICSLKHFPSLGAASGDTHVEKVTTLKTAEELMNHDWIPFKAGIEAGAPMVMVGHMSAPNVDEQDIPSTTSSIMIGNLLRRDLGFNGVVITDALNMAAVTDYFDSGMAAISCIKAGCDMLLMPEDFSSAYDALLETVKSGAVSSDELNGAVARILAMKIRYFTELES